ncbi:hypothetical protein C4J92_1205 [Pseudomonas sp. R3-18-08]|nr:hypothetical protein C4J92_1205 [Pseudomonas sp. R3-18-08]
MADSNYAGGSAIVKDGWLTQGSLAQGGGRPASTRSRKR